MSRSKMIIAIGLVAAVIGAILQVVDAVISRDFKPTIVIDIIIPIVLFFYFLPSKKKHDIKK